MLGGAAIALALNTGVPFATAAPASLKAATAASSSPFAPNGFEVQGSNGYTIFVFGIPAFRGRGPTAEISVQRGHARVNYSTPATVTETSIQANLGELGEISVSFHSNGQTKTFHLPCSKQSFSFESGDFEGTIDFHGEEDYTEVEAKSAPSAISVFSICFTVSSSGGGRSRPGAGLYLRTPGLGPAFGVVKRRPSAAAHFYVSVSEYLSGISIERSTALQARAGSFRFDPRLQHATVHPPAPFSGTAIFDRSKRANHRWQGDLAVDLPGRADVPLTGRQIRAYLAPH